jgi:sigma-E factor negative regulatory protein RseB
MARPGGVLLAALVGLGIAMGSALADPLDQEQATAVLKRIADAARQLNFKGTFVYQHGDQVETSRIVHYADGGGEYEKLETLDGPRREIIRTNDEVLCYYPEAKIVRSEKRAPRRTFPALLPDQIATITEQYRIRKGEIERVAGYDSVTLELEPRDGMRYAHKFWTEAASGLLLKARMIDDQHNVIEQFSFTQLQIGAGIDRSMIKPTFKPSAEWRVDRLAADGGAVAAGSTDWVVRAVPSGFRKILETRRAKQGNAVAVTHMVYSDGLASVSVFIEPSASRSRINEGLTRQGAINIYTRTIKDQVVTVLGETPAPAVQQIGDSVAFRGK